MWRAVFIQRRYLGKRQIFGEARCRATFASTSEQSEKGSSRWLRTHRAAAEVAGNGSAPQSLLHERLVLFDIAQQDRDAIEGRALLNGGADAAGDFDAFETFAGRRKKQIRIGFGGGWLLRREEPRANAIECSGWLLVEIFGRYSEDGFERLQGPIVTGDGSGKHCRRFFYDCGQ